MQEKSLIEKGENAMMEKWDLWDYCDVWGNEQDGYEVNDCCKVLEDITITDEADNDSIIEYLKIVDYLRKDCKTDDFYIMWDVDYIEIFQKSNGFPLCCFRKEYEVRKGD